MKNNLEVILKNLEWVYGIVNFLFFNAIGWILIIFLLFFVVFTNSRNEKGYFSFSKFLAGGIEKVFFLFSNIFQIIIGVIIILTLISVLPVVNELRETISLYKEVRNLSLAVKNLKSERKILEAIVDYAEDKENLIVKLKYFAYSPVRGTDIMTGESEYVINGSKVYVDSIVINFDYSLIESGKSINLALPYKIFSDKVSFDEGISINAAINDVPLSVKIDNDNLFLIDQKEYESVIKSVVKALNDKKLALKMGIRTFYSEAIALNPSKFKKYSIYSTGSGGLIVK